MTIVLSWIRQFLPGPLTTSALGRSGETIERRNVFVKQLLRIMKLTAFFLLIFCLHVSANVLSQKITLTLKNVPLKQVLKEISKQGQVTIVYNEESIKAANPVSINVKEAELIDVLRNCLSNQPLSFELEEGVVTIKKTKRNESGTILNNTPIIGLIHDPEGNPVAGVSVMIKGTKNGTTTDKNGQFTLTANIGEVLLISFVGYESKEVQVTGETIYISLAFSVSELDQAQVIAYGKTSKRLSTGNVSTVTAKDIEKSPVTNVLLALQGRVPGVYIEQQTGFAGSGVKVRIQGQNSITSGNDPLYVIDGVPYPSTLNQHLSGSSFLNGIQGSEGSSPINYINPSDIESISILKDADATSIYGSRAANGAILITTKRGKAGEIQISLNAEHGIGQVGKFMRLMSTQQYLKMIRQAVANDGIDFNKSPFDDLGFRTAFASLLIWDTTQTTDWQKELIGGKAKFTDINLSFSGGDVNTRYILGTSFHKETMVIPGSFSDRKGGVHFSINSTSSNQRFRLNFNGNYQKDNNSLPSFDLTKYAALTLPPNAPKLYSNDGTLNWEPYLDRLDTWYNPLAYQFQNYNVKTDNLIGNMSLEYVLTNGLAAKTVLGYNNLTRYEIDYTLDQGFSPSMLKQPYFVRQARYGNSKIQSWNIEPQVTYNIDFGKHNINALAGLTFFQNTSSFLSLTASDFNSDQWLENVAAANMILINDNKKNDYKYNAAFIRIGYDFGKKFLINGNFRRDGSSRFGPANRFNNFGSIAAAWIFSAEPFIKNSFSWINFGKLRASYGSTGNDQIGDYRFLSLYRNSTAEVPYQTGASAIYPEGINNPYLQWEETRKLQFGLDLNFGQDRLMLSANYNRNTSSNQLVAYSLPSQTGFTVAVANFPALVLNSGWEFSLGTQNINKRYFKWSSNFNITIPKNKLLAFDNLANSTYANLLSIGESVNIMRRWHLEGVDEQSGIYVFRGKNGALTSSPEVVTDETFLINPDPRYYGGFSNTFTFKNITLDILLQFSSRIGLNYKYGFEQNGSPGVNQPVGLADVWGKPGDVSMFQVNSSSYYRIFVDGNPNFFWAYSNLTYSNAPYTPIRYLRVQNVSLSWTIPDKISSRFQIRNSRVFVKARNLFTFTNHYIGLDPETQSMSLPPLRIIVAGLNITF